jgi:signal transduction histidine kinase/ActR/RegA family two-component response regulator
MLNKKKGNDRSPCSTEFRVINKNGEFRDIESRSVDFFDEHGKHMGVRGISRDVTERKKQTFEKLELQKNLNRAKKMEALGLLAGGVAHDLNNILSGIINYPELILLDMDKKDPVRKHVEAIYSSGRKAAEIVDDLLTVARGAARKKEHVQLNSIVSEYLSSAEYDALMTRYPSVRVNVSMAGHLQNTMISPVQLKKTILNLMTNAVESLDSKGHVSISTRNITLSESIRGYNEIPAGDYVLLSVADTGSGISSEELDRIFEPFYSKKIMGRSGTGLGLAIVWNTVQDSEGHINVVSGRNGTVFDLYFPAYPAYIDPTSHLYDPSQDVSIKGKGEKILVVDDESLQREIASQILSALQYSAVAMESGEKAIEYLKHEKVDLVLLDMVMGTGMNGRETFEKIIEEHPGQKVVIATGYVDSSEVVKVRDKGADELLKKPYTMDELGRAISRKLNRSLS